MFSILSTFAHLIDVVLLQPITLTIETVAAIVYYFLAGSCFIGYCLVEGGKHLWRILFEGYQIAGIVFKECTIVYCELREIVCEVFEYVYYGTGDGLQLAHNVGGSILEFLSNVLIGLGNGTLWILMLLPRAIIAIVDLMIYVLSNIGSYIVEGGINLLNNLFRLSIGIAVLLVLYMFRGYVLLIALHLLRKLRNEVYTKICMSLHWAWTYTDQQLSHLLQKLHPVESPPNNRTVCVVCLERNKSIVLLPCRHLCLCQECSQQLHRFRSRCPVCRHYVDTLMPVYS